MSTSVLDTMRGGLTPAYNRGMERITLSFGATSNNGTTTLTPYDFQSYSNLYRGLLPDSPRYLLVPAFANGPDPLRVLVWFKHLPNLPEDPPAEVVIPARWPAGRAVMIRLPGHAADITNQLRLTRLQPQLPASQLANDWTIVALLGNLAKLLWAVGWEHEEVAQQSADVAAQRNAAAAHGASQDLLGRDLGVPRFPPTPYTWDSDTLALYHLDDKPVPPQPEVVSVVDDRSRYQATSHPGQNTGGHSRRSGRFANAFEFIENQTFITVPDDPEFALPAGTSFTVEAVIKPARASNAIGAVIAKRAQLNTTVDAGWALSVGTFRGIDRNLRFSLSDAAKEVELFADLDIGDGVFHHVAGVVEHRAGPPAVTFARLYLDGIQVAIQQVDPIGALTNNQAVVIGFGRESVNNVPTDVQYVGLVDEVRISKIARSSFNPVVGEGDDQYRRRLRIFQRWLLPTPDALEAAINEVAGPVANDPSPFIVDETTDPFEVGTLAVRVLPAKLKPGECIAADGGMRASEASAAGIPEDDDFDPAWLRRHEDRPHLDFLGIEANRMMQWVVRQRLDALLDRLGPGPGTLTVVKGYDPLASDLHRVGRALLLSHDVIGPDDLTVQAHAGGFGWTCHTGTGQVHVAEPAGEVFRITPLATGQPPQPPDVVEGADLTLGLDPNPSSFADAEVHWSLAHCGFGDADLIRGTPMKLRGKAAGDIFVDVEVRRRRHTGRGSRKIRIGLADNSLAAGDSIGGDGRRGIGEADGAGGPSADFSELYLETRTDDFVGFQGKVDFGNQLNNRRMQPATGAALLRLLSLISGGPGSLAVVKAYDPGGNGLVTDGRALWLRHTNLTAPALAARAFASGFDFVRIDPGPPQTVQVAVRQGDQVGVLGPSEVMVGNAAAVQVSPAMSALALCLSADGGRAYVTGPGGSRVTSFTLIASAPNVLPKLAFDHSEPVPPSVTAIAFGGGHVFVSHQLPGTISVLDPATLAPSPAFATGPQPSVMVADGNQLFVGCIGDNTLRAYDVQTNQQLGSVVLPGTPLSIAPIPGGAAVYVVITGDRFCQVNRANMQLVGAPVATGVGAVGAVVTPNGAKLYVACTSEVRVYTTNNNQQTNVLGGLAPYVPAHLAVGADQKYVYVASTQSAGAPVRVIDAAQDVLLPQLFTPGGGASWLATSPGATAYATCLVAVSEQAATITLGDPAPLGMQPPRPPQVVAVLAIGSGGGEHLAWSTVPFSRGRVELASLVKPFNSMKGLRPGATLVRAIYVRGDHLLPYQFEVRLNQNLDGQPNVTIRKDQYDLVMNVLNWFHPIGVEVRTNRLRAHVVELNELGDLFPGYTFPVYHSPGLHLPEPTNPSLEA